MADSAAAAPMTIDFLRARLLSERSVSRASKERADQLATRVAELEEQVRAATTERRQAEREAAEVLAILESQGFCGSSLSGSASDNDGDEDKDDARVTHGDTERSNGREERQQEPPPASALSGTPAGGLSWKGRSVSPRKARQLMQRHRRSHLYLLASGSDPSPKYRMGQSCRKNKRNELSRSATPEGHGEGGGAVLVESRKGQQNGSDCTDDGRTEVDGKERSSGEGGQYVMRYEKDGEMERVLEKQAELIGQHGAKEEAQRDWERKFNDTRSPPKVLGGGVNYYIGPIQFLVCFGAVVASALLAGQSMKAIYLIANPGGTIKLYVFVAIFGVFLMTLAQLPSFHSLRHVNLASLFLCLAYSLCAVAGCIYLGNSDRAPRKDYSIPGDTSTRVYGVFNAIATSYGNGIIPEIQATVAAPVTGKMFKGLCLCYAVAVATFFSVATAGYWAFGNAAKGLLLYNFMADGKAVIPEWLLLMTELLTLVQISATAVVYLQPTNEVLEGLLSDPKAGQYAARNVMPRLLSRTVAVAFGTTIAAMVPFFGDMNALIGAFGFLPLDSAMPAIFYNLTFKPSKKGAVFWINTAIAVVFSTLAVVASVSAVRQIVLDAGTYKLFANV